MTQVVFAFIALIIGVCIGKSFGEKEPKENLSLDKNPSSNSGLIYDVDHDMVIEMEHK